MTVARDTILKRAAFTTSTPANLTFTPVGTPRGVVVFAGHGTESSDLITGVTYGGVAMTRVDFAQDTADEPGATYAYFLGASIPTGVQTVAVSHTGSATSKWMIVASVTAAADTEIGTFGKIEGDVANPQIALDTGATSSLRYSIIYTGHDAVTSLTVLSGMEAIAGAAFNDFGTFVALLGQQTTASTGSFTIGYTGTSEDVAMVAVAIREAGATGTVAVTQDAQTSTASGTVANPVTGTVAITQANQTSTASGLETITGTVAANQVSQTSTASGVVANPVSGTVAATQADQTSTASGTVVSNDATGTVAVTQADQTSSALGLLVIVGSGVTVQASQIMTGTGLVNNPVSTFWSKNPVGFVKIGAGDDPPWN